MKVIEHIKAHKNLYIIGLMGLVIGLILGSSQGHGGYHGREGMRDKKVMHKMEDGSMMEGMEHESAMEGMMMDMNANLEGKTGDEFDKAFLTEMTIHHEGAVSMARKVIATSKRPELVKLANDIIAAQMREINMMKSWLNTWFVKSPSNTVEPTAPTTGSSVRPIACTMEARICPDGSSVGRSGPNCEFTPCPGN